MAIIIGKVKCWFCKQNAGVMYSVQDYGIYGDVGGRIFYHPECLEMVEIDPEKFSHRTADKAIQINELYKQNRDHCNVHIVERYQKKVQTLHQWHFEKMMPKKG